MQKCTIHVLLGSIEPRFRYHKMQILWSFQGTSPVGPPPGLYHRTAGELVAPPSTQMQVVPTTWHAFQTKRQKSMTGGGAPLTGLPRQQLHSLHATVAGKELSLSSWCIASLYICHCSTVVDFSSEKYSGSTGHRKSLYQQRNFHWGCRWWDSENFYNIWEWEVNHSWAMINI